MKKLTGPLVLFIFSTLLYSDFFKERNLLAISITLFLLFIYCIVDIKLEKRLEKSKEKIQLAFRLQITVYLLILITTFTLLGGKSNVGIDFNNIFLWIVLIIAFAEIFSSWLRVKKSIKSI